MAGNKYLEQLSGVLTEVAATQSSAGVANANQIPALDATGHLDSSLLPSGIGADTQIITASEALAAGNYVNVWSSAGAFAVRKADASTTGKDAMGFVLAAVSSGNPATVYFQGSNTAVTAMTPGVVYLSDTTPGQGSATPGSGTGHTVQRIGFATSATVVNFNAEEPITLA